MAGNTEKRTALITGAARGIGLATTKPLWIRKRVSKCNLVLASSQTSYVHGQILSVDGGFESTGVGLPAFRK